MDEPVKQATAKRHPRAPVPVAPRRRRVPRPGQGDVAPWLQVLEWISEAVLVVDEAHAIVAANPAGAALLQCAPAELVDTPLSRWVPPRQQRPMSAALKAAGTPDIGRRAALQGTQAAVLRADGSELRVESTLVPLCLPDRRLCLLMLRDVCVLRQAPADLLRAQAELRRLAAAQDHQQQDDRRRIARELHDELQQTLATIRLELAAISHQVATDPAGAIDMVASVSELAMSALVSTRRIVNDLRPPVLEELGLVMGLESLAERFSQRTGIDCVLHAPAALDESRLAEPVLANSLYRVVQEALKNTARHARADRVDIWLSCPPGGPLVLRVDDDGVGIRREDQLKPQALGLLALRERVRAAGGHLRVERRAHGGTTLEVTAACVPARGHVRPGPAESQRSRAIAEAGPRGQNVLPFSRRSR